MAYLDDTPTETQGMEIKNGHTYEARRPRHVMIGFDRVYNDRMLIRVWQDSLQYDSPNVKDGMNYPTVSRDAFLKWAGRDVTSEMPKGDWRPFNH